MLSLKSYTPRRLTTNRRPLKRCQYNERQSCTRKKFNPLIYKAFFRSEVVMAKILNDQECNSLDLRFFPLLLSKARFLVPGNCIPSRKVTAKEWYLQATTPQNVAFRKGNPLISVKSRLVKYVKYYNLARSIHF